MLNKIQNIIFFPEIFLTILIIIFLMIGLFQKKNAFNNICNLSCVGLIFTLILIYANNDRQLASGLC